MVALAFKPFFNSENIFWGENDAWSWAGLVGNYRLNVHTHIMALSGFHDMGPKMVVVDA